jgi:hypothetical protein
MYVKHPRECMDFLCVADLGTWNVVKLLYPISEDVKQKNNDKEFESLTSYTCRAISQKIIGNKKQKPFFSPIGALLSGLYSKLAWTFPDMRNLDEYFRNVGIKGGGGGQIRKWDTSIYTEDVKHHLYNRKISNSRDNPYDEWTYIFNLHS